MYLVDDNKNLVDYASYVFDLCHPVGEIYIRYPGQSSPRDLYKRGTWDNISDEYAGLFFRAEGGNANPFEGGSQEDKIRNITGELDCQGFNENAKDSIGAFSVKSRGRTESGYSDRAAYSRVRTFDANANTENYGNPMAGHADGPEIRPVNTTIQIWRRTG